MRISVKHSVAPRAEPRRKWATWRWLAVGVLLVLAFGAGAWFNEAGTYWRHVRPFVRANVAVVPHWIEGRIEPVERLTLDIKHADMESLRGLRAEALETGVLVTGDDAWVRATLRSSQGSVRARLRLKGDWTDHLESDKWSFRVKVRNGDVLFGMREFSLQHPRTRNYAHEWLYHEALRREDVVALRYDFVAVTLNGRELGMYALEEHFDRLLLESNRRREGPILRFNEDALWDDRRAHGWGVEESPTDLQSWFSSTVDTFNAGSLKDNPVLSEQFAAARETLEEFRKGEFPTREVFDVERLARYQAVSDLLGALHGAGLWHNLRFYANPVTGLLEPIAFDGNAGSPLRRLLFEESLRTTRRPFLARVFADPALVRAYVRELDRVSEPAYLETLLAELHDGLRRAEALVHREWPERSLNLETLRQNARYIRESLSPARTLTASIREADEAVVQVEFAAVQVLPIEVLDLACDAEPLALLEELILVPGKPRGGPGEINLTIVPRGALKNCGSPGGGALTAVVRLAGLTESRREEVAWRLPAVDGCDWRRQLRRGGNVDEFAFLQQQSPEGPIFVKPGEWTLDRALIVPAGRSLVAGPATRLVLRDGGLLVSASPLHFAGTEEAPVVVSSDGTGGVAVLGADGRSSLSWVSFRGLGSPGAVACGLTGAVTFEASPVDMQHVQFVGGQSEDALNIVRTDFRLESVAFRNSFSDALDVDFGEGSLIDVLFEDCGNDGLDVSGSRIEARGLSVFRAGDKAVSAGEGSTLVAEDLEIADSEIGLASKDRSRLTAKRVWLHGCRLGLTAYQKKPEFGPAFLSVDELRAEDLRLLHLAEQGSEVVIDGFEVETFEGRVEDRLYGVEFGRGKDSSAVVR